MAHFTRVLAAVAAAWTTSAALAETQIQVVDPQGAAIPGAMVRYVCGSRSSKLTAGADGIARFACDGAAEVRAAAPGFEAAVRTGVGPGAATVELRPAALATRIDVVVREFPHAQSATGSAAEIEQAGARTVLDAVERLVPGAFVTRRGAMGYGISTNGTGGIGIRGIGGQPNTGVLVVIDGRPDFQGLMGHPLPDFYTLADAESVTITEGPASVLYDSNAMAGAVEIQPRRPEAGMRTSFTASGGSFATGQYRFSNGSRLERGFYNFTADAVHTAGDRASSAFRNQDASVAAGYDLTDQWRTSLQGRYGFFHVEDPGPATAPLNNSYARVGRGGFSWNLDNAGVRAAGYTRVYGSWGRHFLTDGFRSTDSNLGFRTQQTVTLAPALTVDLGGDLNRFGGRARNALQRLDYGEHRLTDGGPFARAEWTANGRVQFTGGLRYHRHSLYGGIVAPEAGVRVRLHPRYAISLAAGRGFRNPTIRELYLFPAPNPALQPESMWNAQASFHAQPVREVDASVTLFHASLRDSIVTLGRYPNLRLVNGGAAINKGAETRVRWNATHALRFNAGYAWVRSTNLQPLVPRHKLNYSVDARRGRLSLNVGGTYAGDRYADAQHTREFGAYGLLGARAAVLLRSGVQVFAVLDNLLNRSYEVVPGYPMPGVNGMGGVTVAF